MYFRAYFSDAPKLTVPHPIPLFAHSYTKPTKGSSLSCWIPINFFANKGFILLQKQDEGMIEAAKFTLVIMLPFRQTGGVFKGIVSDSINNSLWQQLEDNNEKNL